MGPLRRMLRWMGGSEWRVKTVCPVCRRRILVPRLGMGGPGTGIPILRTVDELVAFCTEQHGTKHPEDELAKARAERLWR